MDFRTPASAWTPSPPRRPIVTLTFDLQNIIRSSVGASEYSLSVLCKLFKAFMRYRGNYRSGRTNERTGQHDSPKT